MEKDTVWTETYFRIRYLDLIEGVALSPFETRDVIDRLLMDLGIKPNRLGMRLGEGLWLETCRKWCREMFGNYTSEVYNGIVEEYLKVVDRK